MPRNKYPERTEQALLETAKRLFLERGYEHVTLQDIADACGLTRGAIYHHFRSKEEVVDAVTTRLFQETTPFARLREDPSLSGLERLRRLVTAGASHQEQLRLYAMLAPTFDQSPRLVSAYLLNCRNRVVPMLRELIAQGIADGSIPAGDPDTLAEAAAVLTDILLSPLVFPGRRDAFLRRVRCAALMLEGAGLPLMDEAVTDAFQRMGAVLYPD